MGGDSVAGPFFRSRFRAFSTFSTLIILFSSFARIIIHDMFYRLISGMSSFSYY